MNRYDPELLHRRRVITFSVLTVAVMLLITGFLYGIGVLHRSSTKTQQAALKSNEPVVVMYYSKTCPYCKKVAFDVHKNAWEVTVNQATIGKLMPSPYRHKNLYLQWQNNEDKKLFKQNNVNSVPTFMVYRNGKPQPIANANGIDIYQYFLEYINQGQPLIVLFFLHILLNQFLTLFGNQQPNEHLLN